MKMRLASLLLASFVALGAVGTASAEIIVAYPGPWMPSSPINGQAAAPSGDAAEVGVAFNAFSKPANPRAECEASGGSPKRKLQDDGRLAWICVR